MPIPARLHFCWIGRRVPWVHAFAATTAAARGGIAAIALHHTDPLEPGPPLDAIDAAGIRRVRLDPEALLREAGGALGLGDRLVGLHRALDRPVARADLLRAALLLREGGIYLDLDTVTVAPLAPLLAAPAFAGEERVVWAGIRRTAPLSLARGGMLDLARRSCRAAPGGWGCFRAIETLFPTALNNAVLGAAPGSAVIADMLAAMARMSPGEAARPFALGPRLLAAVAPRHGPAALAIHPPDAFYPLGPEVSAHWFREARAVRLDRMLGASTRIVHWYASNADRAAVAAIAPARIASHRDRVPYCALVARALAG